MILKKYIKINLKFIKKLIYLILAKLIIINIYLVKIICKFNIIINNKNAFGDTFSFCIENYYKIIKSKKKILTISSLENKIIKFFFPDQIFKFFLLIPSFIPFYPIHHLLKKNYLFNKSITKNYTVNDFDIKSSTKTKKIIFNLLKKNECKISSKIKKIKKNDYFLMHIKHYSNDINNAEGSSSRSTSNLNKILKTIKFLKRKNIKVVILGDKFDLFIKKYKKKIFNDVVFFEDLSKSQSILDQLYIHYNSKLCIGNPGGAFIISMYLQKKIIFIDSLRMLIDKFPMMYQKNTINLFKKIIVNNKIQTLNDRHVRKILQKKITKYQIVETSFKEIKKHLKDYI